MKAISLWQPWASAMMRGVKQNETRSWPTEIRGDVAICSAKRLPTREELADEDAYEFAMKEPYGFVLCVVELFDCVRTESMFEGKYPFKFKGTQADMELGNYTSNRFAWLTRNCRPLSNPIPVIGRQGWFNLPDEIEQNVTAQFLAVKR